MKKAITLVLAMVLVFSLTTVAVAGVSTSAGGNLVMFLTDDYDYQDATYYGFDTFVNHVNVYLKVSQAFTANLSAGATIRINSETGSHDYETEPWAKWSYDKFAVTVGTKQGDRVGYSNDLDLWGNMYATKNENPGIKLEYNLSDSLVFTGVVNSAVINNEDAATFYTLGKLVYSKDGFLLGGGYQSGADKKTGGHIQNTGGWAAFIAAQKGKVKWDTEYEYRNSQISPLKSKYYANDDTSALLTNLVYEGDRLNLRLRYYQSDKPGFRAIADDYYNPNSPDTFMIDLDTDYNMYDYVRRYGLEAQIVGAEFDLKLNNVFSVNGFVYNDLDLGTACTYYTDYQRFGFANTGIINYKVGITQQVNDKFSIWYGYKEWYAYQYVTKLTYNWGRGLIANVELGYGKTMLDEESEDDHIIAVAKLQCTF